MSGFCRRVEEIVSPVPLSRLFVCIYRETAVQTFAKEEEHWTVNVKVIAAPRTPDNSRPEHGSNEKDQPYRECLARSPVRLRLLQDDPDYRNIDEDDEPEDKSAFTDGLQAGTDYRWIRSGFLSCRVFLHGNSFKQINPDFLLHAAE